MSQGYFLQDSRQVVGNDMLFWAQGRCGYTTNLDKAHVFTLEEALDERETDIPWAVEEMRARQRPVVDVQSLPYSFREQYQRMQKLARTRTEAL